MHSAQPLGPIKDAEQESPPGSFTRLHARYGRLTYAPIAGIVVLAVAAATWCVHRSISNPIMLAAWWAGTATLLFWVYAFFRNGRSRPRRMATGRIVAIVPAYEQDPEDLHACVRSILDQHGVVVGEVHVVDDGSTERPVQPFSHPRVRWHRTRNGGGHAAAGYVLDRLEPDDWDFVLIVDGACVLEERALECQLRALSRPQVAATTGLVITRNSRWSLSARIADLTIGASSAIATAGWSPVCLLESVSGTPVLYRAHIPFRHRQRHLTVGGHDDNRRLALSAALEGEVVGVSNAIASVSPGTGVHAACRRRLGWSTSWWRMVRISLTGASGRRGLPLRLFGLLHLVVVPSAIGVTLMSVATSTWWAGPRVAAIGLYAGLCLLVRYAVTALYLIERPATSRRRKVWTWLLLTPAEAVCQLLLVIPIRYVALARLCARGRRPLPGHTAVRPGAVYYSGYLPDRHGA
jgi:hypothetical protein